MSSSTAFWAAIAALINGGIAVWLNPQRRLNRALFGSSLHFCVWFVCLHFHFLVPEWRLMELGAVLVAALFPLHLCVLKEVILSPESSFPEIFRRAGRWFALTLALMAVPFVERLCELTPETSDAVYIVVTLSAAVLSAIMTLVDLRTREGAPRLEVQVLVLCVCFTACVGASMVAAGIILNQAAWKFVMPIAVVSLYSVMAWALTTIRVLDARHIVSMQCKKITLAVLVALFVWGLNQLTLQFMPAFLAFALSVGLGLWFSSELRPWLKQIFYRESRLRPAKKAAFDVARKELRPEALEDAFVNVLKRWALCNRAVIFMGSHGRLNGEGIELSADSPEVKALHALRWATPERLEREKHVSPGTLALMALMRAHGFGAMVASAGPSLALIVAVGVPMTRRPYTYHEIGQLLELEAIIENALSRAHYLMKAQHAEQLATVGLLGASIAHEIRNPLVSIKTFVQLLPKHYADPAFRDKFFRLIGDEVARIDRLTEQLLDLSAPRVFAAQLTEINPVLKSCIELVTAKAEDKGVKLLTDLKTQSDVVYTDPNAVKQVVLNLSFNAIQALEQQPTERWVRFETRQVNDQLELAISDSGPGIAPEVWSRLFQPFQSTKSSGFGLGLAICKDILSNLHGSIVADPPVSGKGATFRITLPCQPPTS